MEGVSIPEHMELNENADYWRAEYKRCERNLVKLQELSYKAVKDYEVLFAKYNDNQTQFKKINERLVQRENEIFKIQSSLEPVTQGILQLQNKYTVEADLRTEAEKYASQVHKQNVALKRQSNVLLQKISEFDTVDISIDDLGNDDDEVEHYQKVIKELEEEIVQLKTDLSSACEDRDTALDKKQKLQHKLDYMVTEQRKSADALTNYEKMKNDFKRVSVLAVGEIKELQRKLDEENRCKKKAMMYASKMHCEHKVMARQSQLLIGPALSDEKLTNALMQIEELTTEFETLKESSNNQILELKEKLAESAYTKLEYELKKSEQKMSLFEQESDECQKRIENLEFQIKVLNEQLDLSKKASIPIPPPPPPPPPPSVFTPLKKLLKHSSKSKAAGTPVKEEKSFDKVLKEMMIRIQSDQPRRKASLDEIDNGSMSRTGEQAVTEFTSLLSSLKKRSNSSPNVLDDVQNCGPDMELRKALQKRSIRINEVPVQPDAEDTVFTD